MNDLLEDNDDLKNKIREFNNDSKQIEIRQDVEKEYIIKLSEMQKQLRLA